MRDKRGGCPSLLLLRLRSSTGFVAWIFAGGLRGEVGVEGSDAESGADTDASGMELELLTGGAESEGEVATGEAFASEGVEETPRPGAGDIRAVGEDGTDGEKSVGGRRSERLAFSLDHAPDDAQSHGGEAGDLAEANAALLQPEEM